MPRVVICDPPTPSRRTLAQRVRAAPDVDLVATLDDPAALTGAVVDLEPDLVLLASQGLSEDTTSILHLLRDRAPRVRVVLLTMGTDPDDVLAGIQAGAVGYLARDAAVPEVAAALAVLPELTVGSASTASGPGRTGAASASSAAERNGRGDSGRHGAALTGRELQVLERMSQGRSNSEIGQDLFLSEDTIKTHARRLFRKLEVNDRAHAVAEGFRRGILV